MYYLVEITVANGTPAKAVWEKNTQDDALMQLHQTLASAMANPAAASCLCMVIDGRGMVARQEYWERTNVAE